MIVKEIKKTKLLTYLTNNKQRINYKTYLDDNLFIGSGAMESANKEIIQKRMKLSGQRWTLKRTLQVVNLSIKLKNNKWDKLVSQIKMAAWQTCPTLYPKSKWKTNYFNVIQSGEYSVSYTSGTCTVESNLIKVNIEDKQQSIKTNNWNDTSSWACGTVPIVTDEVIINKRHTISLPNNYTEFLKNLELNGILQKGNNAQLQFQTN